MSYPRDEWIKADPDFWKPKAHAAAPQEGGPKAGSVVIRPSPTSQRPLPQAAF